MLNNKTAVFGLLTALIFLGPLHAAALDVGGTWILTMQTPMGERVVEAVFEQKDETLKASWTSPQGTEMKGEGTVKGTAVEWKMNVSMPGGEIELHFKGTIEGETMSGEILMGDFGTASWSAKRKK